MVKANLEGLKIASLSEAQLSLLGAAQAELNNIVNDDDNQKIILLPVIRDKA
ncbi:hypothetical protein JCM14036_31860 [Desulfotomaculum defluvii]